MVHERYTLYWTPEASTPLAVFEREWFGRCLETGEEDLPRNSFGLDTELADRAIASPRRYGLHATIKAPFRPWDSVGESDLAEAIRAFCVRRRAPRAGRLRLHRFSRYLALVPEAERAELEWLEAECVTHFDRFRAPLDDSDRARRSAELPPDERALLEQFGYPYIFSKFFFHITLAGPLSPDELEAVEAALSPAVEPFTQQPFTMRELCLLGDPGGGALFQLCGRFPFGR